MWTTVGNRVGAYAAGRFVRGRSVGSHLDWNWLGPDARTGNIVGVVRDRSPSCRILPASAGAVAMRAPVEVFFDAFCVIQGVPNEAVAPLPPRRHRHCCRNRLV